MLIKAPFAMSLLFKKGKTNTNPQSPPHTILGCNQESFRAGAMATPNCFVIPYSPNAHTVRLFARAPRHPAAKQMSSFFISPPDVIGCQAIQRTYCSNSLILCLGFSIPLPHPFPGQVFILIDIVYINDRNHIENCQYAILPFGHHISYLN